MGYQNHSPMIRPTPPHEARWAISFCDLLSLLLTFFILIFSMTTTPKHSWDTIRASFSDRLNPAHFIRLGDKIESFTSDDPQMGTDVLVPYVFMTLQEKIRQAHLPSILNVTATDDILVITIADPVPEHGTDLSASSNNLLEFLAETLSPLRMPIEVSIHGQKHWQASLDHGLQIAEMLQAEGLANPIHVVADLPFSLPIAQMNIGKNKKTLYQKARPVDIVIHKSNYQ